MRNWTRWLTGSLLTAVLLWFLWDPETVRAAVMRGLRLCGTNVIPALFPFLAVSGLVTALGFGDWLSRPLEGVLRRLYHVSGAGASALVLGALGGYPAGARTVTALYSDGSLSKPEAERLMTFVNNANPATLISALGVGIFHSVRAGVWLWLIHLLSALLAGLLLCRTGELSTPRRTAPIRTVRFAPAFTDAIRSATAAMLYVCGFVVLFHVLAEPLTHLPGLIGFVATGLLEQFSAIPLTPDSAVGFVWISGLAGWGGLSVHCQIMATLADTDLDVRPCLLGKALQGLLALAFAALVLRIA